VLKRTNNILYQFSAVQICGTKKKIVHFCAGGGSSFQMATRARNGVSGIAGENF
jgi:hypothetical protein